MFVNYHSIYHRRNISELYHFPETHTPAPEEYEGENHLPPKQELAGPQFHEGQKH